MNLARLLCFVLSCQSVAAWSSTNYRKVEFVQEFKPAAKEVVELWIPAPLEDVDYQRVISRDITGNATLVRVVGEKSSPAPFIYARWDGVKEPTLKIVNVVEVADRTGALKDDENLAAYLAPTRHVQTDGIVADTASKITKGINDPDRKARAIYDWMIDNTARDPGVRGCGLGDAKSLLESGNLKGKCADLSSLFVALARASGVPAREVYGQRIASSGIAAGLGKEGDNSKAQHCRAEFFSDVRQGWVPVDPADVRKFILEEKLEVSDPKVAAVRERFFGSWEGTWIAFNYARDFQLNGYDTDRVNYFMYPLLVAAKFRPDGIEPQETGYTFSASLLR